MTRIPSHTIEDAAEAARPLLQEVIQFSPTGRLLNLHAQMAHSPAVLAAYVSIRQANSAHGTLEFPVSGLTVFTAYFQNYARTEPDLPWPGATRPVVPG